MRKQLLVIKADGTTEEYIHTKVIGTINNALSGSGRPDMAMAEDLAEVVTYYLYRKQDDRQVSSSEILSMVKAVLVSTGCEAAAVALGEHSISRRLRRSRTEILAVDMQDFADVEKLRRTRQAPERIPWDKSRVIDELTEQSKLSRQMARVVAAMVEERIFGMGMTLVPQSLLKQLVLGETAAVLQAQRDLQTS
ncbi:MAG: ATP cone domain-containing protein [Phycisphaerales bacterium]|jgi:transcriptional regulator NrdR family protein